MSKIAKTIAVLGVVAGLGVAALPMSTYAADYSRSASAIVTTQVEGAISITTDSTTGTVDLGKLALNGETKEMDAPLKVTVTSNSPQAYTLTASTLGEDNAMLGKETGAKINAGTPAAGTSAWGYKHNGTGTMAAAYSAVPASTSPATIKEFTPAEGATGTQNDAVDFMFKASANGTQTPDTYEATVVFTATVKDPNAAGD